MKKPWYMNIWIWIAASAAVITIPFLINEAYKRGAGYITAWQAQDVLSFYGSLLSFAGTVVLGLVAVEQSRKANQLSQRMLDIEDRQEIPVIDIIEIMDGKAPTEPNALQNALQVSVNHNFYFFKEDNSLADSDTDVVVFQIKNISSTHIISMRIGGISAASSFHNGKNIPSEISGFSYNGGLRVFGEHDCQYMVIGGIHYTYPNLSEREILDQDYINPAIDAEFQFLLGNIRGRIYEETIRIRYVYVQNSTGVNYPCMLSKEIRSITEIKES